MRNFPSLNEQKLREILVHFQEKADHAENINVLEIINEIKMEILPLISDKKSNHT